MKIASYVLFAAALVSYVLLRPQITALIAESREAHPDRRFGRFFWDPAWVAHRAAYPQSTLRRRIALRFGLTFLLTGIAMGCLVVASIRG